jgi:DNA ligase (NAD+)
MLKADGLTCELIYEDGKLKQASTRGNGVIGEEIFHNAKTFKNIPLTISYKGYLKLAGEAIIHKNDFEEINSKLPEDEKYATPRNLSSGSVRQLDSKICAERNVYFYAFSLLESENKFDTKSQQFEWLDSLGFRVIPHMTLTDTVNLETNILDLKELAEKKYIPIDGMVVSFNDIAYSESLPKTLHHPLHSLSFKFFDERKQTALRDIEWSVGRTADITPVAIFDKVIIDNTEVTRASLHNISIIEELELGIGDIISVIKCNMIIPQIADNFTRSNNIIIPDKCPACGANTAIEQLFDSKVLKCTNDNCGAKKLRQFMQFVSRDAMNIEGLSEQTLEKFISKGFISSFKDIFKLNRYASEISTMEGFGKKSYDNLIKAIEKSRNVNMVNFIYSLGINQIGLGGAKRLAKHFDYAMPKFLCAISNGYDLTNVEDFGQITSECVYDYFKDNYDMVVELLNEVKIQKVEKKESSLKSLEGLTFVVTGSVNTFKNRNELEELITSLQGKLSSGVSSKTNYLINNDTTSTSGKNQKAKELGVKIINEQEFNEMIGR